MCTVLAAATAAGGCSRDEEPARGRDRSVSITIRDYRYTPQDVRVGRGRITFRITNRGRVPHNFNVRGPSRVRLEVSTMLPGERSVASVTLGPGVYRMFCSIGNHEELGEYGKLEVK